MLVFNMLKDLLVTRSIAEYVEGSNKLTTGIVVMIGNRDCLSPIDLQEYMPKFEGREQE
jgi:hypothetical protein